MRDRWGRWLVSMAALVALGAGACTGDREFSETQVGVDTGGNGGGSNRSTGSGGGGESMDAGANPSNGGAAGSGGAGSGGGGAGAGGAPVTQCDADALFCSGGELRRCASDGTSSELEDACDDDEYCDENVGECVEGTCAPNGPACNDDVATVCNDDGSGYESGGTECDADETCSAGECEAHMCNPDADFCSGNQVLTCSSNGLASEVSDTCDDDEFCDDDSATCEPDVCTPGALRCGDGEQPEECRTDGSGWAASGDACEGDTPTCFDGECVECVPNATSCDGDTPLVCASSATWDRQTTCAPPTDTCDPDSGTCIGLGCGQAGTQQCGDGTAIAGELCFSTPAVFTTGTNQQNLAVLNFDRDAYDDLVVGDRGVNKAQLFHGSASGLVDFGTFNLNAQDEITSGNLNDDDLPDIISLSDTNDQISFATGDGTGNFGYQPLVDVPAGSHYHLASGDLDADGRDDVVVLGWTEVNVFLAGDASTLGDPTTVEFPSEPETPSGADALGLADIDGQDGLDIVFGTYDTGHVVVLFNDGSGGFDPRRSSQLYNAGADSSDGVSELALGDINQDQLADVLANDANAGRTYVHLGTGSATSPFTSGTNINVWGRGGFVLADLNLDCAFDFVADDGSGVNIYPNRNDGTGTFLTGVDLMYSGAAAVDIASGDFNGDGVPDVAIAAGATVTVFHSDP